MIADILEEQRQAEDFLAVALADYVTVTAKRMALMLAEDEDHDEE
ncbi:MAG TPA: hypothetical protein PKC18_00440 [Lacipirellulaceae bacterium]|nr:hypothetical protein [Lacipirellulaceae bacterium]HMP07770.1 hypothetical protein [Lacipirellulaceae bacterium]